MSEKVVRTFWCLLEPCQGLRYGDLSGAPAGDELKSFGSPTAFCAHLSEEHDFDVILLACLEKRLMTHADGPRHSWDHYQVMSRGEMVGYQVEKREREPEDAASWAAAGDEDA